MSISGSEIYLKLKLKKNILTGEPDISSLFELSAVRVFVSSTLDADLENRKLFTKSEYFAQTRELCEKYLKRMDQY